MKKRLDSLKQYLPWLVLNVLVTLVLAIIVIQSNTSDVSDQPAMPPPLVAQMPLFPEFINPAVRCYQLRRWPNTMEYCDYRMAKENDAGVKTFYAEALSQRGWKPRDADKEGWKSPTKRSLVLAFSSQEQLHFFLEKPIKESSEVGKQDVYRVLFTTILNTHRDSTDPSFCFVRTRVARDP